MIRTLTAGSNPVRELERRLRFLEHVEMPMLRAVWGEPEHLGTAALRDYSEREIHDAGRLLRQLAGPLGEVGAGECVQLNDCVALRDAVDGTVEEFVVHAPGLVIRAPGYISADTALGTAVIGRRCGDVIRVETADATRPYLVHRIRRSR